MRARTPLPAAELRNATAGLKPFQERTLNATVRQMFGRWAQRHFLVADEVGLGKTKIARGVIAETIRRHWNDPNVKRIDIIYICSNQQIARQNLADLQVLGQVRAKNADRLTMLPAALKELNRNRVNIIAFTPDTSLRFGQAGGRVEERAMLHRILEEEHVLGPRVMNRSGARALFELHAHVSYEQALARARQTHIPKMVGIRFRKVLKDRGLIEKIESVSDGRRKTDNATRTSLVGQMRQALALACVTLLSPDLIILDEIHRFSDILLDDDSEDTQLANALLRTSKARVLLLSATPYKPLTAATDDVTHFKEFVRVVDFLLEERGAAERLVVPALRQLRLGLLEGRDPSELEQLRDSVQSTLRRIMVRTEKLAATPDRYGMLQEHIECPSVTEADVRAYISTDRVARALPGVPPMIEYWKSAPYLFNFMDDYKVKREIAARLGADGQLPRLLKGPHMLNWRATQSLRRVDYRNARQRWLTETLNDQRAFDLLWVPPSMPKTELAGAYEEGKAFTKRLVFTGWTVAPKAVAALTSYEYEQRHRRPGGRYSSEGTTRLALESDSFSFANLALLMPSLSLANFGDPVAAARDMGVSLPLPLKALRDYVRTQIEETLSAYLSEANGSSVSPKRWYAGAQYLLDDELRAMNADDWFGSSTPSSGLRRHLEALDVLMDQPIEQWGRPPSDLLDVLTDIAIAGPAVCFLRALRQADERFGWQSSDQDLRSAAAQLAWSFRSIINGAGADHLITSHTRRKGDFWRKLLQHCIDGGLGSTLDEWFHLLPEQLRLDGNSDDPLGQLTEAAASVLRLADGQVGVELYEDDRVRRESMRTNFAMRFGQARGATAEGENPVTVRNAFNSPFRPFVLVSTSVGQEGLDFHYYSHAVVHWNLPRNPVDLEQREGRVHRYKGHAVRKNIGEDFGHRPEILGGDPWSRAFALAAQDVEGSEDGLRPWWVYPGTYAIERHVPILPLSRETKRFRQLIQATSLYRMTLGQPRQEELVTALAHLDANEQERLRRAVTIDLSP